MQQARHVSHLICAYPFFQTEDDPVLKNGALKAIHKRVDSNLGNQGCGWSWGHVLNIAARLRDKELVRYAIIKLLSEYEMSNLMTKLWEKKRPNEAYEIQQLDAACAISSGLIEALVFSRVGYISLLPAWPFQNGKLCGVHLRGHVFLREMIWNDERISVVLEGDSDTTLEVCLPEYYAPDTITVHFSDNEPVKLCGWKKEKCSKHEHARPLKN